jgi:hypothetical protein
MTITKQDVLTQKVSYDIKQTVYHVGTYRIGITPSIHRNDIVHVEVYPGAGRKDCVTMTLTKDMSYDLSGLFAFLSEALQ